MLDTILIAIALQVTEAPEEFYESQYSQEVASIFESGSSLTAETAVVALQTLAEQGDVSAIQALGEVHFFGFKSLERDLGKGCDYFEQVGDRRADSLHNLASCYWNGEGREQDYPKARELYVKAANAGWAMSFCAYGKMLIKGQGGPVDAEEGLRLCRITALRGDKDAQTDYGTFLLTGEGAERDPVTARFMLVQAAEQKQANAAFLLGQIHAKGDGTPVDNRVSGDWFAKAYEYGRRDAAEQVAISYMRRGYIRKEGDQIEVRPELLRKAQDWYRTSIGLLRPDSERIAEFENVIASLGQIIERAEGPEN